MVITTTHIVLGVFIGITFLGMFTLIGYYFYLGYTRMDSILEAVKNCSLINSYRFYLFMGPWGKMMMVAGVGNCLLFSKYLIKHGALDKGGGYRELSGASQGAIAYVAVHRMGVVGESFFGSYRSQNS
ncbi:hypothetical protein [Pseudomonas chlororaphis]|uniref:hypothetical protein n=1 Tax=Pseudomonas chlororaphis TaxID=587753 RepID=UPI0021821F36|nr:hypothetical protein [Pseudomonas chlororaphis]